MDIGRDEFTFFWFIENYSHCWHGHEQALISPPFTADGLEGTAWTLQLYPRGFEDEDMGHVSFFLDRNASDAGPESVSVRYELSFLAADGSPLHSDEDDREFEKGVGYGVYTFLEMDEIFLRRKADYLPRDILTVRCKIWKGEGNVVHNIGQCAARTRIGIETISFLHMVENFSALEPNRKNTIEIRSHSKKGCFISSSLYFTHDSCREGGIVVEITPSDSNHILSKRKISLLDRSGNAIGCGEDDNRFDVVRKDIRKLPLSLTRQVILNKKSEYLPDGKLSLFCECAFSTGLEFEKIEETQHEIPMEISKRANNQDLGKKYVNTIEKASVHPSGLEDIKDLYVNQCLTDVELKTKTKSFAAHRIVLCARSPVFRAMMTSDVKEKYSNCIQVDDLGDDVVQQLLHFLYSDTVENLQWEMATQLYYAADKYQVGKLKEVCSSFLMANLTPANAGELLLLADTHSDSNLKKLVEHFILVHDEQVFGSDEWEMLMQTHPLLVMKAMHLKYKRRKLK